MRFMLFLFSLLVLQAAPAIAQEHPLPACKNGHIAIVRVSEIKPGAMNDFLAAVKAHKAWYRKNGVKSNDIFVSRVIVKDKKTTKIKIRDWEVRASSVKKLAKPSSRENLDAEPITEDDAA